MNLVLVYLLAVSLEPPSARQSDTVPRFVPADSSVTFTTSIAPLLKANCTPCHFSGGTVFEKYPFELYETAFTLRTKLGTRLKEPDQQALLARWLQGGAKE